MRGEIWCGKSGNGREKGKFCGICRTSWRPGIREAPRKILKILNKTFKSKFMAELQ